MGLIIEGKSHELVDPLDGSPIKILNHHDTGLEFKAGIGFSKKRIVPIKQGVIHWTGDENDVKTLFKVLAERKLGVEYCIDAQGDLFQFCDMMKVDTADAGDANKTSWGVEIVNAGIRRANTLWREPQYRKEKIGPRRGYDTTIHGVAVKCWDFYPKQFRTLCALNALIAKVLPTYSNKVCYYPGVVNWSSFTGAIGHYNITRGKIDPGTEPMWWLKQYMDKGEIPQMYHSMENYKDSFNG